MGKKVRAGLSPAVWQDLGQVSEFLPVCAEFCVHCMHGLCHEFVGRSNAQPSPLFSPLCFGNFFFFFWMVEKREEGQEVRVMRGEGGEGSSHCPPVVAAPLLDTAFRSKALEEEKLVARANDGGLGHFY